jgi:hypothetical protein
MQECSNVESKKNWCFQAQIGDGKFSAVGSKHTAKQNCAFKMLQYLEKNFAIMKIEKSINSLAGKSIF